VTARRLTRAEILDLLPASTLADLAGCLGVSQPVVRRLNSSGELERIGIKVVRLGQQYRVVTATVWEYLGISPDARGSTAPASRKGAGRREPSGSALRWAEAASGAPLARRRPPVRGDATGNERRGSSATGT